MAPFTNETTFNRHWISLESHKEHTSLFQARQWLAGCNATQKEPNRILFCCLAASSNPSWSSWAKHKSFEFQMRVNDGWRLDFWFVVHFSLLTKVVAGAEEEWLTVLQQILQIRHNEIKKHSGLSLFYVQITRRYWSGSCSNMTPALPASLTFWCVFVLRRHLCDWAVGLRGLPWILHHRWGYRWRLPTAQRHGHCEHQPDWC